MNARQPAEWMPHEAVWIGFPSHEELWEDDLAQAQSEVAAFARAVDDNGNGERVILVAANDEAADQARASVTGNIAVIAMPFGDIWLRDTGPILVNGLQGLIACDFRFNGWGGKYVLDHDDGVGAKLAGSRNLAYRACPWIFEGGAIDVDGTGLAVTTEQCLLNPNRNPGMSKEDVELRLAEDLGIAKLLWLGDGLAHDHTDGHVDNLARFVAESRLLIPVAADDDDPNAEVYVDAARRAAAFGLDVVAMPSPGRVERDGEIVPASYMNFYIGNKAVVMPTYRGGANEDAAIETLSELFPDRAVVGIPADGILTGGGSFHCISQQIPASAS